MTPITELFGVSTTLNAVDWAGVVQEQRCPFSKKVCYKTRKSEPDIAIGACSVRNGRSGESVIICPSRFLQNKKIFFDCLHLLTFHEPGNEIHIVPEIKIPGGYVDYILASTQKGCVKDFVGIEIQSLDTTGTVWPARQQFLTERAILSANAEVAIKNYGINWKMTAKTILVQLYHKIMTFEHLNKKLALVAQNCLFNYMKREFSLAHLNKKPSIGCSMHFHLYEMTADDDFTKWNIELVERLGTDANGVGRCLGIQANPRVELEQIVELLQSKISGDTLLQIE